MSLKKLALGVAAALAVAFPAAAADDSVTAKNASGTTITFCSKDVGGGVMASCSAPVDTTGTKIDPATSTSQGAPGDTACATDNGTCAQIALLKRANQRLTAAIAALGSPFQAGASIGNTTFALSAGSALVGKFGIDQTTPGTTDSVTPKATESHLGETGSNAIAIAAALTGSTSPAYASGDVIDGKKTLANAARVSGSAGAPGTSGLIQSVTVNSKSAQTAQIDILFFATDPAASTFTDNAAVAVNAADFDKLLGVAHVYDWTSIGTGSIGQAQNLAIPFALTSSTTIYAVAVVRGSMTLTATTDLSLTTRILRN